MVRFLKYNSKYAFYGSIFKDVRTPIVIWRDNFKHHTEQVII